MNKGKPSGKYAETKTSPGRKGDYKRTGWPEEAPTQRVASSRRSSSMKSRENVPGLGRGRNRKAGSPR
jgi:hypothetical protein